MKAIWKFPLEITDAQSIRMPIGAEILSVQFQHDDLVLWALVDPGQPRGLQHIRVIGTGPEFVDSDLHHLASVQEPKRPLVWHVFERRT